MNCLYGFGSAFGLGGDNVIHGAKHGVVDDTGVIEDFSNNPLNVVDLFIRWVGWQKIIPDVLNRLVVLARQHL